MQKAELNGIFVEHSKVWRPHQCVIYIKT